MLINRLAHAFRSEGVSFAVVGGYAVALHGAVRGTVDVDIVLKFNRKDFLAAEKVLKSIGLTSRLPVDAGQVFDFREDYIKNRNLVAWSFFNPGNPAEIVDIIITHDLGKMKIDRIKSGPESIPIVSRRDLIAMKRKSGRPQDIEDIKALEELE
jgi:hypothetical protein